MPGLAMRRECMTRVPKDSSPELRGEEPRSGGLERGDWVKGGDWMLRTESMGRAFLWGVEEGGENSRPNFEGTEAATAPCLAM